MAKHKSITHLPPPAPAPRLIAQLFVIVGELSAAGLCVIGIMTVVSWLLDGHDANVRAKAARPPDCIAGTIGATAARFAIHHIGCRRYEGSIREMEFN
jgi:hypothetical protein